MQLGLRDTKQKSGLRDSVPCIMDEEVSALSQLLNESLTRVRGMGRVQQLVGELVAKLRKREQGIGRLGQYGLQKGLLNVNISIAGEGPWRVREDDEWYHVEIPGKVEGVFMLKDSEFALAQAAAFNAVTRNRWLQRKGEF
jgi:hypothetical protein